MGSLFPPFDGTYMVHSEWGDFYIFNYGVRIMVHIMVYIFGNKGIFIFWGGGFPKKFLENFLKNVVFYMKVLNDYNYEKLF